MIHSFWILKSTILVFHQDWGKIDLQDDLFSGLLSALNIMANETMKKKIHSIIIEDYKFIFDIIYDFLFIICADKEDNNLFLHKKLIRMQIHFIHEFHDIIPNWSGDVSIFKSFKEKADKIISSSTNGTMLYCEYCEKIILDEFLTKRIGKHDFYFCNNICEQHFVSWYSKFIENSEYLKKLRKIN